jgi:putative transposase
MRCRFYPFEKKPFHLVHRSSQKKYDNESPSLWTELLEVVQIMGRNRVCMTHALVLMRNHVHWLWSPADTFSPETCLSQLTEALAHLPEFRDLSWEENVFAIDSFYQYREVYKYIYRNPVEAGLVRRVEDYPFSTLQNVLGIKRVLIGVQDPFGLIFDQYRMLSWLNTDDLAMGRTNFAAESIKI